MSATHFKVDIGGGQRSLTRGQARRLHRALGQWLADITDTDNWLIDSDLAAQERVRASFRDSSDPAAVEVLAEFGGDLERAVSALTESSATEALVDMYRASLSRRLSNRTNE